MQEDDWIRPPAPGARYRWRERRHGQVMVCEWLGVWHNPARRTHHALWRLPSGDERFAEALDGLAEMLGEA
ncbi:hypothetical protein ACFOGJ_09005 [Marinibaculum pumilum]|uniref:Uncharacterized protein n=1 Tax=Marinibaculum pumilum TaxID=1766165 RepID=A0ABV7KYI6_9PROT